MGRALCTERQVLTSLGDPANVSDVAATATAPYAALAVAAPFAGKQGASGNDLVRMDTASGELSPLLARASGQESFGSPAWWFDASALLLERDRLTAPLPNIRVNLHHTMQAEWRPSLRMAQIEGC